MQNVITRSDDIFDYLCPLYTSEEENLIKKYRNRIETVFSSITSRMPRQIKAKTEQGFCLKVLFLVLAYMMSLYFRFS